MDLAINYFAVVVAALASFVIGWLWYSPVLFVKPWMRLRGMNYEEIRKGNPTMPVGHMLAEFVSTLVVAYVLATFIARMGATDIFSAAHIAIWAWIGFYATTLLGGVLWEKVPFQLYMISAGRWLVSLIAMAVILGAWH